MPGGLWVEKRLRFGWAASFKMLVRPLEKGAHGESWESANGTKFGGK